MATVATEQLPPPPASWGHGAAGSPAAHRPLTAVDENSDSNNSPLTTLQRTSSRVQMQGRPQAEPSASPRVPQIPGCPPHGCKAICGARPRMEDAYTAVPFLLEVPISDGPPEERLPTRIAASGCLPDAMRSSQPGHAASLPAPLPHSHVPAARQSASAPAGATPRQEKSALHFFGVFDGHGGAEAALLCARTLHERLAEALSLYGDPARSTTAGQSALEVAQRTRLSAQQLAAQQDRCPSSSSSCTAVSVRSASGTAANDAAEHSGSGRFGTASGAGSSTDMDCEEATSVTAQYSANAFEHAFAEAFSKVDEEFGRAKEAAQVGTTAVVALVGDRQLYVGNCGDSRAVLCRAGRAIALTDDHKAAREDETARVEAAGGEVMWWNGERVMGVLAVSRAIGDHYLRPFVIAEPEVTILGRSDEDELLLLASDGLWDVLSNQEACSLAQRCLRRAQQRGASRQTAARVAASVLTRAAIDQGSSDNVTVVVVDLSREKEGAPVVQGMKPMAEQPLSRSQELQACHTGGEWTAQQQ